MSTANPTALRIGATGNLNGIRYRVVGRVVLGMEEDGETYYWNEFNLLDDRGQNATLVYEETEEGDAWKLFMMFEPAVPLTVAEAARKRVGDIVNLDGSPAPITLRDSSRVCHIEGRAPEGVEFGDVAEYFNIDDGPRMLVASWTGREIEFYRGMNIPPDLVNSAFGLVGNERPEPTMRAAYAGETEPTGIISVRKLLVIAIVVVGVAALALSWQKSRQFHAPRKPTARLTPLPVGASGTLVEAQTIIGRAILEIARTDGRYDCHEFNLRNRHGAPSLLFCGLSGSTNEWHWFQAVPPSQPLLPQAASKLRRGDEINFAGQTGRIEYLLQAVVLTRDGQSTTEKSTFGFVARDNRDWFLARWNDNKIECYQGTTLSETDVLAAFEGSRW